MPLFDVMYGSPNKHRILKDDGLVHELIQFDGVTQGSEIPSLFFMRVSMSPLSSRLDRYKDVLRGYKQGKLWSTVYPTAQYSFKFLTIA